MIARPGLEWVPFDPVRVQRAVRVVVLQRSGKKTSERVLSSSKASVSTSRCMYFADTGESMHARLGGTIHMMEVPKLPPPRPPRVHKPGLPARLDIKCIKPGDTVWFKDASGEIHNGRARTARQLGDSCVVIHEGKDTLVHRGNFVKRRSPDRPRHIAPFNGRKR